MVVMCSCLWIKERFIVLFSFSLIPPLPDITNFSKKYFILSKVHIDESGIKS